MFFFFKQKTAYEMRISDWSSDVCSSDLLILEQAGVPYDDVARRPKEEGGGPAAIMRILAETGPGLRPLAPPVLVHGEARLAQMPNICAFLGDRKSVV